MPEGSGGPRIFFIEAIKNLLQLRGEFFDPFPVAFSLCRTNVSKQLPQLSLVVS